MRAQADVRRPSCCLSLVLCLFLKPRATCSCTRTPGSRPEEKPEKGKRPAGGQVETVLQGCDYFPKDLRALSARVLGMQG